ncbi:MAG: DNA-formamidopyrimidine glycosylase family protein [Ilumatobacteraceae bacterium]
MPELPEVQAHAERLAEQFAGRVLRRFVPFNFTVAEDRRPSDPTRPTGWPLVDVGRRGKYLLVRFEPVTFVIHLMQGGRLLVDDKQSAKPRNGRGRFVFDDGPALLLTEAGTERHAGVWCVANASGRTPLDAPPLDRLGPDALTLTAAELGARVRRHQHAHPRVPP